MSKEAEEIPVQEAEAADTEVGVEADVEPNVESDEKPGLAVERHALDPLLTANNSSSAAPSLKHALSRKWTLWFDSQQKRANQTNWHDSLKNLITFDTVEDFWGVYNNVIKSSALSAGSNFHLFQAGIQPMWEDPQNEKGGKWVAQVAKSRSADLDNLWLNTMLSVIGETFEDADEVLGAVVSVRRHGNRLGLWTKSFNDEPKCVRIGTEWKKALEFGSDEPIGFQAHSDAITHNSSFSNQDRYTA